MILHILYWKPNFDLDVEHFPLTNCIHRRQKSARPLTIYGWYQWSRGGGQSHGVTITTWSLKTHVLAVLGILLATLASGILLIKISNAYFPFLDSFTTWASILTTFMVAKKILENWIYWFVIDGISIFIYLERELYFTAFLFAIYLVIVVIGFLSWLKEYQREERDSG